MKGDYGAFTTPNYPNNYDWKDQCQWVILTTGNTSIELTIEDFEVRLKILKFFCIYMITKE